MQRPFLPLLETQWSQTWHFLQTPLASTAEGGCGDRVFQRSGVQWFLRLQPFHGPRADKAAPMFLDPDMTRPLVYRKFASQFRLLQQRVNVPDDELAGPHGLRVEGYNGTKNGLGEDLAVAHGLWKSSAHQRYDRFTMERVVRIPAVIAGVDQGDEDDGSAPTNEAERGAGPPSRRLRREDVRRRASEVAEDSLGSGSGSPAPGTEEEEEQEEEADAAGDAAAATLLSLTPGGSTARPGGYWGTSSRPGRGERARRSPTRRRSPSRSPSH